MLCKQDNVEVTAFLSLGYYQDPRNVINQLNRELETSFTAVADKKMRDPTSGFDDMPMTEDIFTLRPLFSSSVDDNLRDSA